MVPVPPVTACTTPSVPWAASPPSTGQTPSGSYGKSAPAVATRYSMKFSVVPESSARFTGVIGPAGSAVPPLSAVMAGSDQSVICWLKILAMVDGERFSSSTPSRL